MNISQQERKNSKWRLLYARLIRISNWLMIPLYFFVVLIPGYYVITASLPPIEQLKINEGKLVLKWMGGKKGYMTGVENNGQVIFFTCAGWSAGRHDCLRNPELLHGKRATIWWFEQPVYLFQSFHRIAQIEVESKRKISYEDTQENIRRLRTNEPWWDLGVLVFFVVVVVYFDKIARRIEHEQANS